MILFVRHAKAGSRHNWDGPDRRRPLSKAGFRQAEQLVDLMMPYKPTRVVSSPYLRCIQTVEPLAEKIGVDVEKASALAEGASVHALMKLVVEADEEVSVLCSHGDMIPAALDILGVRWRDRCTKGSTWVLSLTAVSDARYLPPPS
jgi:phosphohistidine phosphatase SixA